MLLAVDIGNSTICFATFSNGEISNSWKIITIKDKDKEYYSYAKGMIIIGNRHFDQQKNIKDLNIPSNEDSVEYYYKSLRDLNSALINIELIYFDDLIDSMKKRLNRFL